MIRDYPGLGSDKTYSALRAGKLADYDVETQLANYRAVWAVIEATSNPAEGEEIYEDLHAVLQLRRATLEAMRATGNARVVIVSGPSGIGKSKAVDAFCGRYGLRCIKVEACDCWADNPGAFLAAILRALGDHDVPVGRSARLERCVEELSHTRRCVFVEEAHHLGQHCLNTVKHLVNVTPGEWVLVAIPTLWVRLESKAYMEARQLSTNRLSERVKLDLTEADIGRYLHHVFADLPADVVRSASKLIRPVALGAGNMSFVRDAARQAKVMAGEVAPTAQTFSDAVAAASRRR